MSIPMEPFTLLGSAILGGGMKLWAMHLEAKRAQFEQMISGLNAKAKAVEEARQHNGHAFQWTRRFIVVTTMLAVIALPLMAPIYNPDLIVTHGWTEWKSGFWFFTEGKDVFKWHEVKGMVVTPMHTNLVSAITGFYFGVSAIGNRR